MARRLTLLAVLLALGGCAVMLPRRCAPGYHVHSVPTDLGTIYVCRRVINDAA